MDLKWNTLDVDLRLLGVVKKIFSFKRMTPVQKAVIPLLTNRKDILCEACTGSGKSIAFIISVLQILIKYYEQEHFNKFDIGALIISPTRELSQQTFKVLSQFLEHSSLSVFLSAQLFIGGNNPLVDGENYKKNGGNIFVVTPGRMVDLLEKYYEIGYQMRKNLQVLIIDETDVLLDMGFEKEVNQILSYLPKQRQTGLFSATQTKLLSRLLKLGLRNPVRVEIKEKNNIELKDSAVEKKLGKDSVSVLKSTGLRISPYLCNKYVVLKSNTHKLAFLISFIKEKSSCKFLLFFSTCAQVDLYSKTIENQINFSIPIFKIHRKLKDRREKIFHNFKTCENAAILLCTDVMSRGIDIPKIDWVVNVDLPNTLQDYIHRSGRSGHQIGIEGNALVLCLPAEIKFIDLCKDKGITFTEILDIPSDLESGSKKISAWLRGEARKSVTFYEKTMRAYVSFLRNYGSKNMMAKVLFDELDFVDLANAYGLLKIPHMPELKNKLKTCPSKLEVLSSDKKIALEHIESLKKLKNSNSTSKDRFNKSKNLTDQRVKMKEKIESCKLKGKKKKRFIDQVEFDELAEDARMVKKLKKGKISQQDFDKHFGID